MVNRPIDRRRRTTVSLAVVLCGLTLVSVAQDWAKRDEWQRPEEVMDALGIRAGSVVADVGAGAGYFTFHLARRVGAAGKVYAVDIDDKELARIRERVASEHVTQVETTLGTRDDPKLPETRLDAILVVNAYHEMREHEAMMAGFYCALKPGGVLGVIDQNADAGGTRESYYERHRVPTELVRADAEHAGFRPVKNEPGFSAPGGDKWYFLVFEKPRW